MREEDAICRLPLITSASTQVRPDKRIADAPCRSLPVLAFFVVLACPQAGGIFRPRLVWADAAADPTSVAFSVKREWKDSRRTQNPSPSLPCPRSTVPGHAQRGILGFWRGTKSNQAHPAFKDKHHKSWPQINPAQYGPLFHATGNAHSL